MERSGVLRTPRDCPQQTLYSRGPSRPATGTTGSSRMRVTSPCSTRASSPAHTRRPNHTLGSRSTRSDRSAPQIRPEEAEEAEEARAQTAPAVSTFLQERLERERRLESRRPRQSPSYETMATSRDGGAAYSSPLGSSTSSCRRPLTSPGVDAGRKGMGLKEMEQTLSNLHKQNFDLKLELYHRRERQTELEGSLDKLEREKKQTDEINDQLLKELEKRDRAVGEAVAMIVSLEARNEQLEKERQGLERRREQLEREREMVRQVEKDGLLFRSPSPNSAAGGSTGEGKVDPAKAEMKTLGRMPSFLWDRTETTENLRSVFLGTGSKLSLGKVTDDAQESGGADAKGIGSPSLSVLSESSFLSVYGQKQNDRPVAEVAEVPEKRAGPADEVVDSVTPRYKSSATRRSCGNPVKPGWPSIRVVSDRPTFPQTQAGRDSGRNSGRDSATEGGSLLQTEDSPGASPKSQSSSRPPRTQAPRKTKQEKREALERMLIKAAGGDVGQSPGLPPTPDTISTSTLGHYKDSQETVAGESSGEPLGEPFGEPLGEPSGELFGSSRKRTRPEGTCCQHASGSSRVLKGKLCQPPSMTAFDGRREQSADRRDSLEAANTPVARPRSAGESILSRRQKQGAWDTDSFESADAASASSSLDPWMRESLKPNHGPKPVRSASQTGLDADEGRILSDLFSFPNSGRSWATDGIFGALGGSGYMNAGGLRVSLPTQGIGLLSSMRAPNSASTVKFADEVDDGPPPPDRRSSLHARTGSVAAMFASSRPASTLPWAGRVAKSPLRGSRTRSNSIDPSSKKIDRVGPQGRDRASTVPPKQMFSMPPTQGGILSSAKPRHYPPTASQAPRSRGLTSFFRRSLGSAESGAGTGKMSFDRAQPPAVTGMSSWAALVDDEDRDRDRDNATPPPIPRTRRNSVEDGGVALEAADGGAPIGPAQAFPGQGQHPPRTSGSAESGGGVLVDVSSPGAATRAEMGRKGKWYGIARIGSMRNRAG